MRIVVIQDLTKKQEELTKS